MKTKLRSCLTVVVLALATGAPAAAQVTEARVRAVVATSQAAELLGGVAGEVLAGIATLEPAGDTTALAAAVRLHFSRDSLLKSMVDHIRSQATPEVFDPLYRWLLADSIRTLEARGDSAARRMSVQEYAEALPRNVPRPEIVELAEEFAQVQQAGEFYVSYLTALQKSARAVARAAGKVTPESGDPTADQLARVVEHFDGVAVVSFLQRFQPLAPHEVRRLVAAYRSESGAWYVQAYTDAVAAAVTRAGERAAAQLKKRA